MSSNKIKVTFYTVNNNSIKIITQSRRKGRKNLGTCHQKFGNDGLKYLNRLPIVGPRVRIFHIHFLTSHLKIASNQKFLG